jgi:pyrimidine oxygenase
VFLPIRNNGWILSETSPQYRPSFELSKQVTQRAQEYGFGFVLPTATFRGYGGRTEHWNHRSRPVAEMTDSRIDYNRRHDQADSQG